MNVTTYDTLNNRGEQIVFLLKNLFAQFHTYTMQELSFEIEKMNRRSLQLKYNEKNIKKIYALLLKGELQEFSSYEDCEGYDDPDPYYDPASETKVEHYPPNFSLGISCNYASTYPPHFSEKFLFPNEFNFALSERLFDGKIPSTIQAAFVEFFKKTIQVLNGVTGFITYEAISGGSHMRTPFENYNRIDPSMRPGYVEHVKGYFWLNYLSDNHISRLGGEEYIRQHAPCEVRELKGHGMILQLTEDINDYSDDRLRALREFVSPLFPPNTGLEPAFLSDDRYWHRLVE